VRADLVDKMPNLCFLDLETTGVETATDRAVEACLIETTAAFEEVGRYVVRINPERKIPQETIEIHGITDEMVKDAPRFRDVAAELQRRLDGRILVGHNVRFDITILDRQLQEAGFPGIPVSVVTIDTQRVERYVNSHRLGAVYERYVGAPLLKAHSSEADVQAVITVLQAQLTRHAARIPEGVSSVAGKAMSVLDGNKDDRQWLDHSRFFYDQNGVVMFGFGKHEGTPARQQPNYLRWMTNPQESTFPEPTRRIARSLLAPAPLAVVPGRQPPANSFV
jgi:DNA polymerase-3 subunit epsilon